MEILQKRIRKGPNSTLSIFYVDGKKRGYVVEDKDRGLHSQMTLAEVMALKVHGQTAIPTGRYKIALRWSPGFKRWLPWLLDVLGFEYIYCHRGNWIRDTLGCLLVGLSWGREDGEYCVWDSKKAFDPLFVEICNALKKEEDVFWEIVNDYDETSPARPLG